MDLLLSIIFAFILYMILIFPFVAFCIAVVRKVFNED